MYAWPTMVSLDNECPMSLSDTLIQETSIQVRSLWFNPTYCNVKFSLTLITQR